MKEQFFEFDYSMDEPTLKEIWQSSDTIFVIDTNVLLNLYSYQETTRNTIFESLKKIEDRLWSPHQVMLEYNKNRNEIIYKSRKDFESISNHLSKFISAHECKSNELKNFDNNYGKIYPELRELFNNFEKESSQYSKEFIENLKEKSTEISNKIDELKEQTVSLKGKDTIREKLATFYTDEKIGEPYTKEEIEKIYEEGNDRYALYIPPGYKDSEKTEIYYHRGIVYQSKFGDLVLYKQILKYCKSFNITNVVFITEDNKDDWKERIPHEKQSYYGIRREIRAEAFEEANIENFITLNVKEFIENSNQDELEESLVDDLDSVHQLYLNYSDVNKHMRKAEEILLEDYNSRKSEILEKIQVYEANIMQISKEIDEIDEVIISIEGKYYTNPDIDDKLHLELSSKIRDLQRRKEILKIHKQELESAQRQMEENLESLFSLKNYVNSNIMNKTIFNDELNRYSIENESSNLKKYFNSNIIKAYNELPSDNAEKILDSVLKAYEANKDNISNSYFYNQSFLDKIKFFKNNDKE